VPLVPPPPAFLPILSLLYALLACLIACLLAGHLGTAVQPGRWHHAGHARLCGARGADGQAGETRHLVDPSSQLRCRASAWEEHTE